MRKSKSGMHVSNIKTSKPLQRLLKYLKSHDLATTFQIQQATRLCNVATWASHLRKQGYPIQSFFRNRTKDGRNVYVYRLKK